MAGQILAESKDMFLPVLIKSTVSNLRVEVQSQGNCAFDFNPFHFHTCSKLIPNSELDECSTYLNALNTDMSDYVLLNTGTNPHFDSDLQ